MCQLYSDLPRKGSQNDSLPVYVKAGGLRNQVISRLMHNAALTLTHTHTSFLCSACAAAQLQRGSCRRVQDVAYLLLRSVLSLRREESLRCVTSVGSLCLSNLQSSI